MSWGYDRGTRYHTLYGQERTQEELRAEHERRKERSNLISMQDEDAYQAGEEMPQHYSVGWSCVSDGSWDEWSESFRWCGSWTAEKIIGPSYHEDFCVVLRLSISGKRGSGRRRRPTRWSAVVCMGYGGLYRRSWLHGPREQLVVKNHVPADAKWRTHPVGHLPSDKLPIGRCKSLADAMRQADRLDLGDAIEKVTRAAYDHHRAKCYYRKVEVDGEVSYEPYMMVYGIGHFDQMTLPRGTYVIVEEHTDGIKGHVLERGQWGTCGSYGKPEDRPTIEQLGVWWTPRPKEKVA